VSIDAIIYDFGGVFMGSPFEAMRKLGDEKGITEQLTLEIVFGPYGEDTDHPWHRCERGELDLMTVREEIRALGAAHGLELDLFDMLKYISSDGGMRDAMVETVKRARAAGLKTAILTNNIVEGRDFWRPMLPLDELFDVVVDSSEVGIRKPNPAIYLHTLELLGGIAPERALFLDDFEGNVKGAEAIGMLAVLVEADPTSAIERIDELLSATPP
jgi:epoxide hydrolase-like predicted phosphatase